MADQNMPRCIHRVSDMVSFDVSTQDSLGVWVWAVAHPYCWRRWKAAWYVLTGRAYAIQWPDPGDLERAVGAYKVPKQKAA